MKVAIYGAGGIIGQHMRLVRPDGVEIRYYRRNADPLHHGIDVCDPGEKIDRYAPDVIVNLAGENRPDVVERDPSSYRRINVEVPAMLAEWCDEHGAHYIHVSSQAVFSGENPPYGPDSELSPINSYGVQKADAERLVRQYSNWTIARATFVVGIRPLPHVGRQNPLEQMLANPTGPQVNDRWFSALSAIQGAVAIWRLVEQRERGCVIHLGTGRTCRYGIAESFGLEARACSHGDFPGIAPRPRDTTYEPSEIFLQDWKTCVNREVAWGGEATHAIIERAREIAMFLRLSGDAAESILSMGFGKLHQAVANHFRRANPKTDTELLEWYRTTESYIWELAAYHEDAGFNYSGMMRGVTERLKTAGVGRVLVLGDGIGDLTMALRAAGIDAVYHDLAGSRTVAYAESVSWKRTGKVFPTMLTNGWEPVITGGPYDAILSLDFLEHVTDVPAWTRAIRDNLAPGGFFMAQNGFNMGSGDNGSIPMHLSRNDRYEKEWDPMLATQGFRQESSNWYRAGV